MEELNKLNDYVNEYYKSKSIEPARLIYLHRKITGLLYYLESVRSDIHDQFERTVFELTNESKSVARSVNEAHVKYPQMYQLRRIMDAGWKVADSIRTNISYVKNEMSNNIKTD